MTREPNSAHPNAVLGETLAEIAHFVGRASQAMDQQGAQASAGKEKFRDVNARSRRSLVSTLVRSRAGQRTHDQSSSGPEPPPCASCEVSTLIFARDFSAWMNCCQASARRCCWNSELKSLCAVFHSSSDGAVRSVTSKM